MQQCSPSGKHALLRLQIQKSIRGRQEKRGELELAAVPALADGTVPTARQPSNAPPADGTVPTAKQLLLPPPPTNPTETDPAANQDTPPAANGGMPAGIAVGVVVLVAASAFFLCRHKRSTGKNDDDDIEQQRRRIAAAAAAGEMLVRPVMSSADATLNRPNRVTLSKRLETTPTVSLKLAVSKAAAHCNQRGGSRVCDFNAAIKKAEAFGTKLLRKWGRQQQQQQQQPPLPKGLTAGRGIRRAQLRAPCAARATVLRQARLQPCWVSMGKKRYER